MSINMYKYPEASPFEKAGTNFLSVGIQKIDPGQLDFEIPANGGSILDFMLVMYDQNGNKQNTELLNISIIEYNTLLDIFYMAGSHTPFLSSGIGRLILATSEGVWESQLFDVTDIS